MYVAADLRLPSTSAKWAGAEFRRELVEWISSVYAAPTSCEPLRQRPWSTVWVAQTRDGTAYAKQNTPPQAFEAGLMTVLAAVVPDHVVPVLAADPARDLLLTPDQGPVLGSRVEGLDDEAMTALTVRVCVAGAQLQRDVVPHAAAMVTAGLVSLGPADLLEYVHTRTEELAALPAESGRALTPAQLALLAERQPLLEQRVETVAALGLPISLVHNDLHHNNVFDRDGRLRFFDFGDAVLGDPLAGLMVPLRGLAFRLGLDPLDPAVCTLADPALEVWSDLAPLADLRATLPSAVALASAARCESWLRCQPSMTDAELANDADAPAYWLTGVVRLPGDPDD